jgi:hypothetical protein
MRIDSERRWQWIVGAAMALASLAFAPTTAWAGDCCAPSGGFGCDDGLCTAEVCAADDWCCNVEWDELCVAAATVLCADLCPPCGDGTCDAATESCASCAADCGPCPTEVCCPAAPGATGCSDAPCQAAVCAVDDWCCNVEWDETCATLASQVCDGCIACGDGVCSEGAEDCGACAEDCGVCLAEPGDCCEETEGFGCADSACEACVCAVDAFCCELGWDGLCVVGAAAYCPYECPCATVCAVGGDVDGDGAATIADTQCVILAALWMILDPTGPAPACVGANLGVFDQSCDGQLSVTDVKVAILYALGGGLPKAIDANGDGCPDACE